MIQDYQTNMVYLAHGLSHYVPVCRNLLEALHREQIHAEFLPYTSSYKHVWARDYMPIQLEKTLVFFYHIGRIIFRAMTVTFRMFWRSLTICTSAEFP